MESLETHLREAAEHLRQAVELTISAVQRDPMVKAQVGRQWEGFLGDFFRTVREKGKESRINLLTMVKFPKL